MADPTLKFHANMRAVLHGQMPLRGMKIEVAENPDGTVTASTFAGKATATAPTAEQAIANCRQRLRELSVAGPGKVPGEPMPEGKTFCG